MSVVNKNNPGRPSELLQMEHLQKLALEKQAKGEKLNQREQEVLDHLLAHGSLPPTIIDTRTEFTLRC